MSLGCSAVLELLSVVTFGGFLVFGWLTFFMFPIKRWYLLCSDLSIVVQQVVAPPTLYFLDWVGFSGSWSCLRYVAVLSSRSVWFLPHASNNLLASLQRQQKWPKLPTEEFLQVLLIPGCNGLLLSCHCWFFVCLIFLLLLVGWSVFVCVCVCLFGLFKMNLLKVSFSGVFIDFVPCSLP